MPLQYASKGSGKARGTNKRGQKTAKARFTEAVAALEKHLFDKLECKEGQEVRVYAWYTPEDSIRVSEVSIISNTGGIMDGESFTRDVIGATLMLGCEQFLLRYKTGKGPRTNFEYAVDFLDAIIDTHYPKVEHASPS